MHLEQPITTKGWLNVADMNNEALKLVGWLISSFDNLDRLVPGFQVKISNHPIITFDLETNLPSPKLKKVFPQLSGAENAQFRINIPLHTLPLNLYPLQDSLVEITPILDTNVGQSLFAIVEPSLAQPSIEDINTIGGVFLPVGLEFLAYLVNYAHLKPTDHILDIGCGVGRMAYTLAYYLEPTAKYEGFDIVENLIQWNQDNITPQFPNFHFQKVNIQNTWYNPTGNIAAQDFQFPYADASFDVIFLTSVFTHLRGYETAHYLDEIKRVLKPGGRCLFTCFLITAESQELIDAGKSSQNLIHNLGDCLTSSLENPELAIGFPESFVESLISDRGFSLLSKNYGSWCGRQEFTTYQDMVVILKNFP